MTANRKHVFSIVLIALLGAVLYANTLGNGFVLDDRYVVKDNAFISSPSNLPDVFDPEKYFEGSKETTYRPLVTLSYMADHVMWKYAPSGYHFTNLVIHILNGMLLYAIFCGLKGLWKTRPPGEEKLSLAEQVPLIAALFFMAHPVQTEAVNSIGSRHELLMTFFYFLGILFYRRSSGTRGAGASGLYLLSLLAYLFSCLSKEMGVTLPAVIVLMDIILVKEKGKLFSARRLAAYGGYAAIAFLYFYIRFVRMVYPGEAHVFDAARFVSVGKIFMTYFRLLLFPVRLSAEYVAGPGYPTAIPSSFSDPAAFVPAAALAVIVVLVVLSARKYRDLFFGGMWFFLTIIPVSNIPVQVLSFPVREKYLYLPAAGFCFLLAAFLCRATGLRASRSGERAVRAAVTAAVIIITVFYSMRTVARNTDWKDGVSLWSATVRTSPGSYRAYYNLGMSYLYDRGDAERAEKAFKDSLRCRDFAQTHDALGKLYLQQGKDKAALEEFRTAYDLDPGLASAYYHAGRIYSAGGEFDTAIDSYAKALGLGDRTFEKKYAPIPPHADMYSAMGVAYYGKGDGEKAAGYFRRALDADPWHAEASYYLGSIHLRNGYYEDSLRVFRKALERYPGNTALHFAAATAYLRSGRLEKAAREYREVLKKDPSNFEARNNIAGILMQEERYDDAIKEYSAALAYRPGSAIVHYNLGRAYEAKGSENKAVREWREAVRLDPDLQAAREALERYSEGE